MGVYVYYVDVDVDVYVYVCTHGVESVLQPVSTDRWASWDDGDCEPVSAPSTPSRQGLASGAGLWFQSVVRSLRSSKPLFVSPCWP